MAVIEWEGPSNLNFERSLLKFFSHFLYQICWTETQGSLLGIIVGVLAKRVVGQGRKKVRSRDYVLSLSCC